MGTVLSTAASGIGRAVGSAITAPLKKAFRDSCEGICKGPWDISCFIQHFCVSHLVKLLMMLGLCWTIFSFCSLLCKLGICKCIVKSSCKMCCGACKGYFHAIKDITSFLLYKLTNTKRVNTRRSSRRPIRDVELGYSSCDESDFSSTDRYLSSSRKRSRERRIVYGSRSYPDHRHVRMNSRTVSVHVKGGSRRLRNSRRLSSTKVRNRQRDARVLKRQRLR